MDDKKAIDVSIVAGYKSVNNYCKDHLVKQQRGKAGSCWRSQDQPTNKITLKIDGKADRTAKG